ncbi:hypothetical protein SH2C18_34930 [Clostridium sediminicola]|uniref:hypothetical protein n=1 Tax=Clostridium sediminicola TaxID=3114879 RepID=UPI0031F24B4F
MRNEDIYLKLIVEDKINGDKDGFHWKSHGRTAMIYFVENNSIVPIEVEMPGVEYLDVLVYGEIEHIKNRYCIDNNKWEVIAIEDRFRIQNLLVQWLNSKSLRHDVYIRK